MFLKAYGWKLLLKLTNIKIGRMSIVTCLLAVRTLMQALALWQVEHMAHTRNDHLFSTD